MIPAGPWTGPDRDRLEGRLSELLEWPEPAPPRMVAAIRYAVLGGGKRLRPMLVLAAGEAAAPSPSERDGAIPARLMDAACAMELVHTFSLIHDDLPALDDDDLRRGRPTLHVRFDEATAVLAGDALLNMAFEVLGRLDAPAPAALNAIRVLSRAIGLSGMIGGQVLDLQGEGAAIGPDGLRTMHRMKTGALITVCCEVGGVLAGGGDQDVACLRQYGEHLGIAFQIVDDILDVEGTAEQLGKSPGKDLAARKATYPAVFGVPESRRLAARSVEAAIDAVAPLGKRASKLEAIASGVLTRKG